MDKTKLEGHLAELEQYHTGLDKQIKEGYTNYLDDIGLSKMKQEKAYIRRQIEETREKLIKL